MSSAREYEGRLRFSRKLSHRAPLKVQLKLKFWVPYQPTIRNGLIAYDVPTGPFRVEGELYKEVHESVQTHNFRFSSERVTRGPVVQLSNYQSNTSGPADVKCIFLLWDINTARVKWREDSLQQTIPTGISCSTQLGLNCKYQILWEPIALLSNLLISISLKRCLQIVQYINLLPVKAGVEPRSLTLHVQWGYFLWQNHTHKTRGAKMALGMEPYLRI